ncbi:MAG: hypothetical protein EOO24_67005, partial [Comamonadaceae bacterium]
MRRGAAGATELRAGLHLRRTVRAAGVMRRWAWLALAWLLLCAPAATRAAPLQLAAGTPMVSTEGRLEHFADPANRMSFDAVRAQRFQRLADFRSLGYGTGANWFRLALARAPDAPAQWILVIGAPDLEEVDVWTPQPGGGWRRHALGYHRPYQDRPLPAREFAVPVAVDGPTEVYVRVRTKNAINVHAELWQVAAYAHAETQSNFYRGLYFGVLLIAVVLYAILGARLRDAPMAAYAGYLASQSLLHLGSNGYLPVLLPSGASWFADALPRIGWLGSAMTIVLMWDRLLGLRQAHPRIHRLFLGTVVFNLALLPFALMPFL